MVRAGDVVMSNTLINFEVWKLRLRGDCEREGRLLAFGNLGEYVIRLLWERGLEPTVEAIVSDDSKVA
jgi:hypothetical protein